MDSHITDPAALVADYSNQIISITESIERLRKLLTVPSADTSEVLLYQKCLDHYLFILTHLNRNLESANAFGLSKLPFCNKK